MKSLDLELNLDTGKFTGRMQQAGRETQQFERNVSGLNQELSKTDAKSKQAFNSLGAGIVVLGNLRSALENTRFFFTGLASSATQASAEIEKTFHLLKGMSKADTSSGAIREAASNLEYLTGKAKEAPFSIQAMTDGFVKMKAGGLDPLAGGFQSILDAAASFGASDEVLKRAFVAIQQMGGKGVVSMEELRQQLGEAIPNAINLMADGLGVTYEELVKQIESGKLRAGPALDAMFEKMKETYGGRAQAMMETYQGKVAQLKSSLLELSLAFTGMNLDGTTEAGGFFDTLKQSVEGLTNVFSNPEFKAGIAEFGTSIGIAANAIQSMVSTLGQIASVLPIVGNLSGLMATMAAIIVAKLGGEGAKAVGNFFGKYGEGIKTVIAEQKALDAARDASRVKEQQTTQQELSSASARVSAIQARKQAYDAEVASLNAKVNALRAEALAADVVAAKLAGGRDFKGRFADQEKMNAAEQRSRQIKAQLRAEEGNLTRATQMQTNATRQLTVATGQLTAAELAAQGAIQRTSIFLDLKSRAALTASVAMKALQGAMAFLGGGWGLILMGIAAGFTLLTTEANKTTAAINGSSDAHNRYREEIVDAAIQQKVLTGEIENSSEAMADARKKALENAEGYDHLADRAKNAAEWVRTLTREQRIQAADKLKQDSKDAERAIRGGIGDDVTRKSYRAQQKDQGERLIRLAGGGPADLQRYHAAHNSQDLQAARTMVNEALVKLRGNTAADESRTRYLGAIQGEARSRQTIAENNEITSALYSNVPEPIVKEEIAGGDGGGDGTNPPATPAGGKGGKSDPVQAALENYATRAAQIREEMSGSATEAAKMAAEISSGKFQGASQAVKDRLMAAAELVDELTAKAKAAEAFKKMTEELEGQNREAELLAAQVKGVLAGQSEAAIESAKYRAAQEQAAKAAGLTGDEVAKMVDDLVAAEAKTRKLNDQLKAAEGLERAVRENREAAADAWDEYIAGTQEANREAVRLERQLNRLTAEFGTTGPEAEEAQAKKAEALFQAASKRAAQLAINMREETAATNIALSGLSQRGQAEALLARESVERERIITEGTKAESRERQLAMEQFYAWQKAKGMEIAASDPMISMFREWESLFDNLSTAFADMMGQMIDGLLDGSLNFKDFAKNMVVELGKIIVKALIAHAILSALGRSGNIGGASVGSGSGFSLGGVLKGALGGMTGVEVDHTGGIVGGTGNASRTVAGVDFAKAIKYHTGGIAGLKPKEVPAVLQEGEGVFTREQMANLAPTGAMQPPNVRIEVINESGTAMDAQQQGGGPKFDGKEYVIGVVMDAMSKPGKMRDSMKGAMAS